MHAMRGRAGSVLALLVAAVGGGAVAGLASAAFIWCFEELIHLVWVDLPDRVGVDPVDSWWLFAIPAVGGVLVGLGKKYLGDYPESIDQNAARWRSGGQIDPKTVPASAINSLTAIGAGGPIGFEAALIGLIGGLAAWIGQRMKSARTVVMEAWGAERIEGHPRLHALPYWLAALSGLFTYRWMPFGEIDLGFRFDDLDSHIGVADGLVVLAFAALLTIPVSWAMAGVVWAEHSKYCRRAPVPFAVAGGLAFAAMAWISPYILFSGQDGIQHLVGLGTGELWYLAVAKWLALVVAIVAGWRGGPIFPMFTAVSACAVAVDEVLDVGPHLLMVGGIAMVAVVILKGSIPMGFLLTLYAVPLSYTGVILLGAAGAAIALAVARELGLLPTPREPASQEGVPA